jgi:hypothetical protein
MEPLVSAQTYRAWGIFGLCARKRDPYRNGLAVLQELYMVKIPVVPESDHGPSHSDKHPDNNEQKAIEETKQPTVSKPGGFKNDPDDPTNPNEAIERQRRKLRP